MNGKIIAQNAKKSYFFIIFLIIKKLPTTWWGSIGRINK